MLKQVNGWVAGLGQSVDKQGAAILGLATLGIYKVPAGSILGYTLVLLLVSQRCFIRPLLVLYGLRPQIDSESIMHPLPLLLLLAPGCTNKNDTSAPSLDIGGDSGETDSVSDDTGPAEIESITLTFTGALEQTLTFDQPACTHTASTHFRSFWRDSTDTHTFVIIAEVLGGLEGAGQYDHNTPGARIKLQEESGGGGAFFQTDTGASDTLSLTLDHLDAAAGEAWGTYEFNAIQGEAGGTSVTPLPIPIRCPSL